ncbi:hypothetical protein COW36_21735 [bacterium (Candidatus Blackallbacteria) CG17_big_fil_post_rev_8_21_14_2_50_48_46]|uniref:Uncharacterized protein n=1 Tax=bacterium (Candidatus Blackallbacteria) CG17_big_fil_post_rev_8_21_14_2_50_48_46 TaxID=2014261 RepID=A0A2M7FYT4_9BACT|nr:MAG: hypothetical protein COW64_11125 [bacterium (Candidatus Blackallbacteria) CG18_big_fil_WC_8_21_14_2_50_49_26]PIW14391.1 MAG: hypothetical protein COW36_21735 [bacterium (Candidatus Blackallbacteria) CG17_big_fil_post_rev_8_21_14_2_50_48_46]PIW46898.1 MAG: hypothetical protein COW20_14150 [bacterium (Candidatus Blackallbacteria) CG13_big_fil_rev_8_21_14_2_50_49_14]
MLKKLCKSAAILICLCSYSACSEPVLQSEKIEAFQGVFKQRSDFLTEQNPAVPDFLKILEAELLQDLKNGHRSLYQNETGFSVLLLAGSEGSHFVPENAQTESEVVYPAILVTAPLAGQAEVFKGTYRNHTFLSADAGAKLHFTGAAWLLVANEQEKVQISQGELSAQDSANQPPATNPTVRAVITPGERHAHEDLETAAEEYLEHQDPNYQEE